MPADPQQQLALYRQAVDALGGIHAASRELGFSERHSGRVYSGKSPLHDRILEKLARALIRHAERCRTLERRLSPAFADNLTAEQRAQNMRGRVRPQAAQR